MSHSVPIVLTALITVVLSTNASAAVPAAPTNLTATAPAYNEIVLNWKDNSSNEIGFEVFYRFGTSGTFTSIGYTNPNVESVSLTGTNGATTYQFQIRAISNDTPPLYSEFAGPATVTTPIAFIVTNAKVQTGLLNRPFSLQLTSSQPSLVTSYSVSALPPGLSLNPATGLISGTPTAYGDTPAVVTIHHTDDKEAVGDIIFRIFRPVPDLVAPVASSPLAPMTLIAGSAPTIVPLNSHFNDPDVASAARMVTDLGNMDFAFYPESAPLTVANFLDYANRGDFTNTFVHRGISNFVIQGGAFRADATASAVPTQPPVVNEPEITNAAGTVAMARRPSDPNSATNQFFINLSDNSQLLNSQNEGFTVFARIAGNGMTVAKSIGDLPTADYSSVNGALETTPVRTTPPPVVYDPSILVRILSVNPVAPLGFTAVSPSSAVANTAVNGGDLSITPIAAGVTTLTVTATDLDNQAITSQVPVTVLDTYDSWSSRQGFGTTGDAAATANPDHDGLTNFQEFALATSPLSTTTANPEGRISNNHLEIAFTLNIWSSGTLVTVQAATDPGGPWTDVWKSTDGFDHPWIGGSTVTNGVATVLARDPATIPDPTTQKKFLRLKID